MSAGSSPASAIARSAASMPISRAVRPDAFVYAVSPMPTIATWPRTSSSRSRVPSRHASDDHESDDPSDLAVPSAATHRDYARRRPRHAHADRHRRDRPDDRLPRSRPPHYYDFLRANLRDHESLDEFEFPAQYMFKDVPQRRGAGATRSQFLLEQMDQFGIEKGMLGVVVRARSPSARLAAGAARAPRPLLRQLRGRPEPRAWTACATSSRAVEELGVKAATAFPARPEPAGADQRQEVLSRSTRSASSSTSRSACARACPGRGCRSRRSTSG